MYDEYRDIARKLGMDLLPADPGVFTFELTVAGKIDGHPVRIHRLNGRGARITTTAPIFPAMDLGLQLGRAGLAASIAELFGTHEIEVGEESFDERYAIRGDEPERVRQLLTSHVQATLYGLRTDDFRISDAEFTSNLPVGRENVHTIETSLREAVDAARLLSGACNGVAPAQRLRAHHAAFVAFAAEHQLRVSATPLWIEGRFGRVFLSAHATRRSETELDLELAIGSDRSLGVGLHIQPRRNLLQKISSLMGSAPIATGDASFDERFELRAPVREDALRVVDEPVRRALVELSDIGAVSCSDQKVAVRAPATAIDPARIPALFDALRGIVERRFSAERAYR